MKKKSFKKRVIQKIKILIFLSFLLSGVFLSYQKIIHPKKKISSKEWVQMITDDTFSTKSNSFLENLVEKTLEVSNPIKLMNQNYQKYKIQEEKTEKVMEISNPKIYLYNTHQSEEYSPTTFIEFSVEPTVIINNYILEDIWNKNGYPTIVEESSIKDILKEENWNYAQSYQASRLLLEEAIKKYPTLEYFIDIHRDSLGRDKTTTTIDQKEYAKVLFVIGTENESYPNNLELVEKINNKLNENYPTLSKGIYKKSGIGVNGVYNQDFSPNTILIEIGGYENTTSEVLNSCLAFAQCFMEVIHE